jgi:hypothetical protein
MSCFHGFGVERFTGSIVSTGPVRDRLPEA